MKKLSFLSIALMLTCGLLFAQQPQNPQEQGRFGQGQQMNRQTPAERAQQMAKEYNLSAQQTTDLTNYFTKQDAQRAEMMKQMQANGGQQNMEANREQMQKVREANQQELKTILGDDNYAKYSAQHPQRQHQFDVNRPARVQQAGQNVQNQVQQDKKDLKQEKQNLNQQKQNLNQQKQDLKKQKQDLKKQKQELKKQQKNLKNQKPVETKPQQ